MTKILCVSQRIFQSTSILELIRKKPLFKNLVARVLACHIRLRAWHQKIVKLENVLPFDEIHDKFYTLLCFVVYPPRRSTKIIIFLKFLKVQRLGANQVFLFQWPRISFWSKLKRPIIMPDVFLIMEPCTKGVFLKRLVSFRIPLIFNRFFLRNLWLFERAII